MKREIRKTSDGSTTLFVPELNEHYHSVHGAVAESEHVFINAGFRQCEKQDVRILEIGFGTGLNAVLTLLEALMNKRTVYYYAIEKYPLSIEEVKKLNYDQVLDLDEISIRDLHQAEWEVDCCVIPGFTLHKEETDTRNFEAEGLFDVIYFDAFAPDVQPELWSKEIFQKLYSITAKNGVLTTYSAKGDVRRSLAEAGYTVEKIGGPPGKRQMLRAVRVS